MQKLAAIYCRVSDPSQVQFGRSIQEQPEMLRAFAKEQGYSVLQIFSDEAKSGTSMVGREGLENAIILLTEKRKSLGKDASLALIVQDTDRFARNEEDHFAKRATLAKHGIVLISKNQPNISDDSAEGRFMDTVIAGVNAFQSRLTGRKVSNVKQRMVEQGLTTHRAPVGYKNINRGTHDSPERGYVELDAENAPKVRRMIEDYVTGAYSIQGLVEKYNEAGLRSANGNPLSRSSVEQILRNSYYAGKLKYKGEEHKGVHPTLIDEALFERCKAMLAQRNNFAVRKRKPENHAKFFLKGMLKCGTCGYSVTADATRGRNGDKYDYYHCGRLLHDPKHHSVKGECVSRDALEAEITSFFGLFILSEDIVTEVLERAKEVLAEMHGDTDVELKRVAKTIGKLEERRRVLETEYLDGHMKGNVAFFQRNTEQIETELGQCRLRTLQLESSRQDAARLFSLLVRLARDLPQAYLDASPDVKKMYLKLFWDRFTLRRKEIEKAVPSEAVLALINEKLIELDDSTPEKMFLISKIWLPRLDSNQRPWR